MRNGNANKLQRDGPLRLIVCCGQLNSFDFINTKSLLIQALIIASASVHRPCPILIHVSNSKPIYILAASAQLSASLDCRYRVRCMSAHAHCSNMYTYPANRAFELFLLKPHYRKNPLCQTSAAVPSNPKRLRRDYYDSVEAPKDVVRASVPVLCRVQVPPGVRRRS
jgi:hypothetical protein